MIALNPQNVTTFPGARIQFTATRNGVQMPLSTMGAEVHIYFPGRNQEIATIHESNNTFSYIMPMNTGEFDVEVLISWDDQSDRGSFHVKVNPVLAARFTYQTLPDIQPTGELHADIYNPMGQLVYSAPMTFNGYNYEITKRPDADWIEGEYRVAVRDETGVLDIDSIWIERPSFASMAHFFELPLWQRQIIEYLKYELMSDTEPLHPGALFTLEEYAKHWKATVGEISDLPIYPNFQPLELPISMANVLLKGTTLRVFHALANRSVTIPRWQNLDAPIQDESHYQQSWEARYQALRPEYEMERAYRSADFLPGPAITVDPWLGWRGGNLAGTAGLALIGRPTWFSMGMGMR